MLHDIAVLGAINGALNVVTVVGLAYVIRQQNRRAAAIQRELEEVKKSNGA